MVALTSFFVALIGIVFVFANRNRQMRTGKSYVNLSFGSDFHLKKRIVDVKATVRGMPKRAADFTAYHAVRHGIKLYDKVKTKIHPKIAHIIEAVKGKDIPKNRGTASIFLKKIEEHKKNLK